MAPEDDRKKFLMSMYDQVWNNMNRHINLIWQPVTVIFTVFGSIIAVESQKVDISIIFIVITLAFLVIGWFLAHVYDSAYWYNRNLIIVTNIEKEFLSSDDDTKIHYFFKRPHPSENNMITHFKIQFALGIGLGIIIFVYFMTKLIQNYMGTLNCVIIPYLPFAGMVVAAGYVWYIKGTRNTAYTELVRKSPGKLF